MFNFLQFPTISEKIFSQFPNIYTFDDEMSSSEA